MKKTGVRAEKHSTRIYLKDRLKIWCGSYLFQIWLSKSNTEKTHVESQLYSATQLFGQIGFHTLSANPVACSDRISRRLLRLFLLTLSFFNRPSFDAFLPAVWPSHHIHHEMAPLPIRVGPSVLAGDLSMLAKDARRVLRAGADFIHLDVFDGNWIKGAFTFGPMVSGMRFFPDVPTFLIRKIFCWIAKVLTPNDGLEREIPLFQGNLGWWNIIIWPESLDLDFFKPFISTSR